MDSQLAKDIIKSYTNGMTFKQISNIYHVSYKTARKLLDAEGIEHSRKARTNKNFKVKNKRILTPEEEKLVCETYRSAKRVVDCCKVVSCRQNTVRECLKKYDLYRTHAESVRENPQNQRKYPVNDNYFDVENERMAYLLGFLAADGCVRKESNEIKVSLSAVDKEFLEIFYSEIGGHPVKSFTTQEGFDVVSWSCTSKHIKEQLKKYNIIPQKTFNFSFPRNLDKKYWRDFIRGYFDGDGSVSTAGPSAIRFQICSATKDVLETIINFFEENEIPRVSIMTREGKHPLYYFQYSTVSTRKIFNILYYKGCLSLPRKKEKYEQILYKNLKK